MPGSTWAVIFLVSGITALLILLMTAVLWKTIKERRNWLEPIPGTVAVSPVS